MALLNAKYLNALKAGYGYVLSSVTGSPIVRGMPPSISFELTNFCNLRCPECASGSGLMKRDKGYMDPELFNRVVGELKPYLFYMNLYFQGEPMLHPDFFSFTEPQAGVKILVSTNGHFLSGTDAVKIVRSGIRKLIVSLDGMDSDTYSIYRIKGNIEKVLHGIRDVSSAIISERSSLKLELQFLVNKYNENQIDEAKEFARSLNATLKLKSMQVITGNDPDQWMPSNIRYRRYYSDDGSSALIKSRLPDRCLRLWTNPVITWDGKVIPCCFDKDADYVMGDLNKDTFMNIWKGSKYTEFRKKLLSGRKSIPVCRNCTSGLRGVDY